MTKGKYKSTSEARQAREAAIQEVDRLKRENARLAREAAAERDALLVERDRLQTEVYRLRGQIADATGDALQAARDQVKSLEGQLVEQPRTLGRRLSVLMRERNLLVPADAGADAVDHYSTLAELFNMQAGEFFSAASDYGRQIRRITNKGARHNAMVKTMHLDK